MKRTWPALLMLFSVGAYLGLCAGVPGLYVLQFGGDVSALVSTARFRVFRHPSACDPAVVQQPSPTEGPAQLCLPTAATTLPPGSKLTDNAVHYRLFPEQFVPEQVLRDVQNVEVTSTIHEGELIRRERVQ